jgi:ATP-dependent Zn protease
VVDDAHATVTILLKEHRDALDRLARALVDQETLDETAARQVLASGPVTA